MTPSGGGSLDGGGIEQTRKRTHGLDQDGGVGRNTLLSGTTKKRITTNLKAVDNQNCQNSNLHGTQTTKELNKNSSRVVSCDKEIWPK